jgi:hypothetical protein
MKRFLFLSFAGLVLATFAWAEDTSGENAQAGRIRQLQRNRTLVRILVEGGLRLAGEDDPLKRADCCNGLAESLAGEIEEAAAAREGDRAVELGQHLHILLQYGVAGNLSLARNLSPSGSTRELELRRVGARSAEVMQPLEEHLKRAAEADPGEMRRAFKAVYDGRAEVEKALKTKP